MSATCVYCGHEQNEKAAVGNLLVNFILDKSGSMECVRDETIIGFNAFVDEQRGQGADKLFSLTLFDTTFSHVHSSIGVSSVPHLTKETYRPNGYTALYDAIGHSVGEVEKNGASKVMCVIMTDGQENSSKEYTKARILDLIKRKESEGWTFVYLGANQDAYAESAAIGISPQFTTSYNVADTVAASATTSGMTTAFYSTGGSRNAVGATLASARGGLEKNVAEKFRKKTPKKPR